MKSKIASDLKEALKKKNELRLSVLRMLSSAFHNREIEKRAKAAGAELSEEEAVSVVRSEAKKRRDAMAEFEKGGRKDLAEKEAAELKILEEYLPRELSDAEIEKIVGEAVSGAGAADFGRIMGEVMKRVKGAASGERVASCVKKALEK